MLFKVTPKNDYTLMTRILLLFLFIFFLCPYTSRSQSDKWDTYYEQSGTLETPNYQNTIAFCKKMADASPILSYHVFGKSARGLDIPYIIADNKGFENPEEAKKAGNVIIMIQACIHPGEPEGKDAGLILLRDIAFRKKKFNLPENITLLFIPIFNVDGHERFGPYNRINQNGPKEMGWRTTAQNLNLNRDYMKAEAPEMQAWLKLWNNWKPDFFIDTHTTDGADYQYVLTYALEDGLNIDPVVGSWLKEAYLPEITRHMFEHKMPIFPYVSFREWHNPRSGLISQPAPPMLSQGYAAIHNRPGLLIETHMLKPYKPRVESTLEIIKKSISFLSLNAKTLHERLRKADENARLLASRRASVSVNFAVDQKDSTMVNFLGINYDVITSDLTGGKWFRYGKDTITFRLPLYDKAIVTKEITLPPAYIIPVEYSDLASRLPLHGIEVDTLRKATWLKVDTYRFSEVKFRPTSNEGHQIPLFKTTADTATLYYAAGSLIIRTEQPSSRIIAHLLEPQAQDSWVSWGYFNRVFEQKEYSETYVMEPMAREMMTNDPTLREKFDNWLKANPSLKDNQWEQLQWFYKQTPYYDKAHNLYPIGRLSQQQVDDLFPR